jgi:hypothetical protein
MTELPAGFRLETEEERGAAPGPRISNLPEGFRLETEEEAAPASRGGIHDTLSSFNDTLTFGLWPKALEMFGVEGEADRVARMRQENPTASVIGDTLGYLVPGAAASKVATKALPTLARNTFRNVAGREMVANAGLEATDQVVRGSLRGDPFGEFDPIDIALSGAAGGVLGGGIAMGSRFRFDGRRSQGGVAVHGAFYRPRRSC